jgi:Cyclin
MSNTSSESRQTRRRTSTIQRVMARRRRLSSMDDSYIPALLYTRRRHSSVTATMTTAGDTQHASVTSGSLSSSLSSSSSSPSSSGSCGQYHHFDTRSSHVTLGSRVGSRVGSIDIPTIDETHTTDATVPLPIFTATTSSSDSQSQSDAIASTDHTTVTNDNFESKATTKRCGNALRYNSTSTLFVSSTMAVPNRTACLETMAHIIRNEYLQSTCATPTAYDEPHSGNRYASPVQSSSSTHTPTTAGWHPTLTPVQAVRHHAISGAPASSTTAADVKLNAALAAFDIPSTERVLICCQHIYDSCQLEIDCIVMSLLYIQRLLDSGVPMTPKNWRPIVLTAFLLASKVWDDLSMWNVDFASLIPAFTLKKVNAWEVQFLSDTDYNVIVLASEYVDCYFALRDRFESPLAARSQAGDSKNNTSQQSDSINSSNGNHVPLDVEAAHRLQVNSAKARLANNKEERRKRAVTFDALDLVPPSRPLHVIN